METSPVNEHLCICKAGAYTEVVISFTQKRGLASNELGLDQVKKIFFIAGLSRAFNILLFPRILGLLF